MILTTEGLGHPQFGGGRIFQSKEMFCEVYMAIIRAPALRPLRDGAGAPLNWPECFRMPFCRACVMPA